MARLGRDRGGHRRRRVPRHMERDHRGPDDHGAAECGVRLIVHPGQRGWWHRLRPADHLPGPRGVDGPDNHAIHIAVLLVTDAFGFLVPIALIVLLRGYRETLRPREARRKATDWKPLLKFSSLNGLVGLGAGFFIPLVTTWLYLKYGVPDTWSGPLLALSNITIGLSAVVSAAMARRYGPVRAIVMATGTATAVLLSLAFVTSPVVAGGFYPVRAALMNMSAPIADSFLMGIVPPEQRGLA